MNQNRKRLKNIIGQNVIREFVPIEGLCGKILEVAHELEIYDFATIAQEGKVLHRYVNEYLHKNILCHIEYPYVDKMYRDTYYHFHATKRTTHQKDCIRISLFDSRLISEEYFYDENKLIELKQKGGFLGYLVVRSTRHKKIGRTFLSPYAFRNSNFHCCCSKSKVLVHGIEFIVEGFPHASQDAESQLCAEVCIWETMEYFSQYSEFRSTLPVSIQFLPQV